MTPQTTHLIDRFRSLGRFGSGLAITLVVTGLVYGVRASAAPGADEATFVPIAPCRLADTRPLPDNVGPRNTPIGANETYVVQVTGTNGNCTIPAAATAVAMNVTAVAPTAGSYMTLFPSDVTRPIASNLNYQSGSPATPNKVDVKLSADGKIGVYNLTGTVHFVADIVGYYTHQGLQDIVTDLATKANSADVYTKTAVDTALGTKANSADVYTKTAVDTALGTKANSADVYTKGQIDGRPFDAVVGGGLVDTAGNLSRSWGGVSVARTGTGAYTITVTGVNPCAAGFSGITAQVTLLNLFASNTPGFASAGYQGVACPSGSLTIYVVTANGAGTQADQYFQFVLFAGGIGVTGPTLTPLGDSPACPVSTASETCSNG